MKRLRGSINVWAVVGVVIVALVGVAAYFVIDGNNKVSENSNSIIGPSEKNGNIGDHIKGNPEASRECSLNIPVPIMIIIVITIYIILPIALIIGFVKLMNKIKRKKKSKNN